METENKKPVFKAGYIILFILFVGLGFFGTTENTDMMKEYNPNTSVIAYPTRTIGTAFTISATRPANVVYSVTVTATNPLLAGSSTVAVYLEYSLNSGSTYQIVSSTGVSSTVGVAVAIQITNGQTGTVSGYIPANALVRLRSVITGTGTSTIASSQEVTN